MRGGRCGGAGATPPGRYAALAVGSSSVLHARRPGRAGRANALISVIETGSGSGCHTPPTASSLGRPWSARSRACTTPTLLSPPQPPARPPPATAAVALDGHDRGRQGSPSRCRCWAARLAAALTRSRPRRSRRCWPGLPPTLPLPRQDRPLPSMRPSGRARRRRPRPDRRRRAPWVLRAPARRGRAGAGHADPQAERSRPLRRAGQPGGWRVVVELPASGSGAGAGAGGGGPAGGGGRPGAGRAPGGGAPLGLAGLA
jgi:translation initiation factor IF-2